MPKQYTRPDPLALDAYYTRHVSAMTEEGLHEKSEIAAELAYRDHLIDTLRANVDELREENTRLWADNERLRAHYPPPPLTTCPYPRDATRVTLYITIPKHHTTPGGAHEP